MTEQDYLDLITSEHRKKPDFVAVVSLNVAVPLRVQDLLTSMNPIFDVETAVGQQLDIIGEWVGVSRNVSIPIPNPFFSWEGTALLGWDSGSWQPALAPTSITTLPDDNYRILIKAKIAANNWDGTTDGAYAIWDQVFTDSTILIQDNQDMSYDLAIVGGMIDAITLALITGGYIPLKPEGVRVNAYYIAADDGPVFGWDVESDLLGGWDESSWVMEVPPT